MKLEMLPGRKGDCMLIHFGPPDAPKLMLVDGGPAGVWDDDLSHRLRALQEERAPGGKLLIDLLVISHVDDDHINGVIRLLQAIDEEDFPAEIDEIWHNSFDEVLGNDQTLGSGFNNGPLASLAGEASTFADDDDFETRDAEMVMASISHGHRVQSLARKLRIPVNQSLGGGLIIADGDGLPIDLYGLSIKIDGPLRADVEELQKEFDEWLRKRGPGAGTASLLAALADKSAANLSSIVLSLEEDGKTLLLSGDARSDRMLKGMGDGARRYDIIKMPHHGSDRNVDEEFFERAVADTYVFSGDGEHGNPERATVTMLLDNRPPGRKPQLVFTYSIPEIDTERKKEYEKTRRRAQRRGKDKPEWDPASMALEALLKNRSAELETIVPGPGGYLPEL
ncbi:MAG: hypothetical protein P8Y58_00615 [Novosphingobium sp.]